jgi:hypothetical protein
MNEWKKVDLSFIYQNREERKQELDDGDQPSETEKYAHVETHNHTWYIKEVWRLGNERWDWRTESSQQCQFLASRTLAAPVPKFTKHTYINQ